MIPRPERTWFDKRGTLVFALWLSAQPAWAGPKRDLPLLFGGGTPTEVDADASAALSGLPLGAEFVPQLRPASPGQPACAPKRPICVHADEGHDGAAALAALDALERAYERLVLVLGLPAPLPDERRGGSDALDVYLVAADQGEEPLRVEYDPPELGGFDRASGFCMLAASAGPLLERAATQCIGEAIALRLDAAETPHVRRAFATALWWFVGAPTVLDFEAIDELQSHPERSIARRDRDATSEGAALWFEYLESTRGIGDAGVLSAALLSASAQKTKPDSPTWNNEPDYVDVVRHTLSEDRLRVMALLRDFAVSRAFVGARDDGLHLPRLGWAGAFGAARFDWVLPVSTLPRRVLLTQPVEPTGVALAWLALDQSLPGKTLGFRAEWEAPVAFAWTLVRLDADGSELGRVDLPFQERATEAEGRVSELAGAAAIVIVGTYLDEVSLAHPFDPDVEPFEPHAATIYLAKL